MTDTDQTDPASSDAETNILPHARETVEELLGKMKIKAEVIAAWGPADAEDGSRPLNLDVNGDDLGMLIGRNGDTLAALQYLTRLILSKHVGEHVKVILDVEGHKRRREEQLRRMANRMAEQAVQRQRTLALEPMPAHERRIIHLELRDHPGVRTESIGEEPRRKVTIVPK